jgi:chromate transporter
MKKSTDLEDIAKLFLKLGVIGFGGPAAHIAMMQEEVVRKRKWLTEQHFLDLIGATNLIRARTAPKWPFISDAKKGVGKV